MGVRVVTDSACDLPPDLVGPLGIEIVPLTIRFGAEEFVDRDELSVDDFWSRLRVTEALPETSAPSAGAFEARFRDLIKDGATGIVCVNLSSRLSATMQAAQLAASAVGGECPIHVIDSMTCSLGLGSLVLTAARRGAAGDPIDEIVADVIDRRDRTRLFGSLDTLEFIKRGGRIGNARALLGTMLSIKPVVEVRDGAVEESGRVRTRSKALRLLADKVSAQPVDSVSVLHGQADDVDELVELLDPIVPRDDIVISVVGPVIGTHAGPGVIGVTFQEANS
ncbi:MAG: DegV family protein [Acidimicrobiia bacterium]